MTPEDIRIARGVLGLSQVGLARALGVDVSTVAHWEQGVNAPPAYLRLALEAVQQQAEDADAG